MTLCPCRALPELDELAQTTLLHALEVFRAMETTPVVAIDATVGNGHDTVFLARAAGERGLVAGFDIQEAALENTRRRLIAEGLEKRVHLFQASHEHMERELCTLPHFSAGSPPSAAVVMFNLGFLPGSDKTLTTRAATTLPALRAAVSLLAVHGMLSVHLYTGQAHGLEEKERVLEWGRALPRHTWRVLEVAQANKQRNKEWLLLAERIC